MHQTLCMKSCAWNPMHQIKSNVHDNYYYRTCTAAPCMKSNCIIEVELAWIMTNIDTINFDAQTSSWSWSKRTQNFAVRGRIGDIKCPNRTLKIYTQMRSGDVLISSRMRLQQFLGGRTANFNPLAGTWLRLQQYPNKIHIFRLPCMVPGCDSPNFALRAKSASRSQAPSRGI